MPCLCYGAISGKEEIDRIKKDDPARWKEIRFALKNAAALIKYVKIDQECYEKDWMQAWEVAFNHMLHGCTEKEEGSKFTPRVPVSSLSSPEVNGKVLQEAMKEIIRNPKLSNQEFLLTKIVIETFKRNGIPREEIERNEWSFGREHGQRNRKT